MLTDQEYAVIMGDTSKVIDGDIAWDAVLSSSARDFRVDIESDDGHPIFVRGWYNASSGKLSYAIIHKSAGRICGLDLGADHRNPDGAFVGDKHKNYWKAGSRDKWAYAPRDITEPWHRPVAVWTQFCAETNLRHSGIMREPFAQRTLEP